MNIHIHVSGTMLNSLHDLLIKFYDNPVKWFYYSCHTHFTDEDTEAQKREVTCPRYQLMQNQDLYTGGLAIELILNY